MARTMSQIESQPIEAQIKQLTEAKRIAQGQKRMNVKVTMRQFRLLKDVLIIGLRHQISNHNLLPVFRNYKKSTKTKVPRYL